VWLADSLDLIQGGGRKSERGTRGRHLSQNGEVAGVRTVRGEMLNLNLGGSKAMKEKRTQRSGLEHSVYGRWGGTEGLLCKFEGRGGALPSWEERKKAEK